MPDKITPGAASLSLSEEIATVEKRRIATGKVRVRTMTESFEQPIHETLETETYDIKRVPIDRVVEAVPKITTVGDLTIIPVVEEVLFVEKRLVLKEEIHLSRRVITDSAQASVTLRRQRAVVEKENNDGNDHPKNQRRPSSQDSSK